MEVFYFTLKLILIAVACDVSKSVNLRFRYTMEFFLPDRETSYGQLCARYSPFYCFVTLRVDVTQSSRKPERNDKTHFRELIRTRYQELNWYSTADIDAENGGCCVRQGSQYVQNGQRKGLSPEQYLAQASNYSSHNKHLMYVTTRFEPSICRNIITGLGFGSRLLDHVRIIGTSDPSLGFIFPPSISTNHRRGSHEMMPIRTFTEGNIESLLTFDWFKSNVICKEQSWICETDWI